MHANDQPTAKTPPYSPKHHIHFTQFPINPFHPTPTTMPKTKRPDSGSSSDDDGSIYSDDGSDDSSDEAEEISANHHHRVFEDVEELKAAAEWKPGRGQLLCGIVRDGKAKYMVAQLEKCDHRDFRFHCDPCDVLLKANSVNAHKRVCLGVKKNRKKMKKKWKAAKKRKREDAKKRKAKENKKRKQQDEGGMFFHFVFWCFLSVNYSPATFPKERTMNGRGRSKKEKELTPVEPPGEEQ